MKKKILIDIPKYKDLKRFNISELESLAYTIRVKLIELSQSKQIHLSSNLGIVELSIALLYLYNSPIDKIIYDTGHQSYVHKILTNRFSSLKAIRDMNGLSGFQEPNESVHDFVSLGHSGSAISIAQGANEHEQNFKARYVPVVGDAALSSGVAFEALNNIAFNNTKMLIVINDNGMSISQNVGKLHELLSRQNKSSVKIDNETLTNLTYKIKSKLNLNCTIKDFFEVWGFKYIGIIDGHDIKELVNAIKKAKYEAKFGPVILHVKTIKGFGLQDAENDLDGQYHSIKLDNTVKKNKTYGYVASKVLEQLINDNKDLFVYNPAMTYSSGFYKYSIKYKNHYEDLGIAEEHAVAKAIGTALVNKKVFVNIYSTFLQRAYDFFYDAARLELPITFLLDRSDLSYGDGNTHHGIYDVSYLKAFNNVTICQPSNAYELETLIHMAYQNQKNPFVIRYSNDTCPINDDYFEFQYGDWVWINKKLGSKKCIISYGDMINEFKKYINENHDFDLINAIFITNYNKNNLIKTLNKYKTIFVVEKIVDTGCLANDLINFAYKNNLKVNIVKFNIKNNYIQYGNKTEINKILGFDAQDIIKKICKTH